MSNGFPGAGKLRQLVDIQKQGPLDNNGQPNPEWENETINVPARVEDLGGGLISPRTFWDSRINNAQTAQQVQAETHRVTLRYVSTLDASRRIIFNGRVLDILSVSDYESRHIYMIVTCRERLGVTS
jgi:hypothetical protein